MQVMKWSALALAVTAGTTQLAFASAQSESKGLVEDSSFDIFNRALYMNRDFKHGWANESPAGDVTGYREEAALGIRLLFESGFTQGTVGVGFDAHSLSNIKLDSGRGRHTNSIMATTDEGRADDTTSEVGGAIKFRVSNTVLKYGNQFVASPVFSTDDSRTLPEVATGTYLVSNEIEGLELSAGRFTAMNSQTNTGRDSVTQGDQTLRSANIVGASYAFTENFSGAIHASDVEDFWKKTYVNLNFTQPLAEDQSLNFDFNFYRTTDEGAAYAGELDNKVWSLAPSYSIGAHKFTVAYQQSSGDTGYNYGVDGGGTVWLSNSVQISDFIGEDEKSWQARYDIDMTSYGVPGLSFMTRYITGDNINLADDDGNSVEGKEHEWNAEAKYVIQEGAAKDLSFRVRHAIHRANTVENNANYQDLNDTRLIVEYPLDVL